MKCPTPICYMLLSVKPPAKICSFCAKVRYYTSCTGLRDMLSIILLLVNLSLSINIVV